MTHPPGHLDRKDIVAPTRDERRQRAGEQALPIYDWADQHLLIPRGSGITEHVSETTPYMRHPLDLVRDRITGEGPGADVETVTMVTGTQVGKTYGFIVPTLAWIAALHPRDLAVILPSHDVAKRFFRNKLHKTFHESERLALLLPRGSSERASRLGIKAWLLDEQTVYAKNGAVALDLRSDDVPVMLWDEFDALPRNVDGEGSPLILGSDRQKTFPDTRLTCRITTPTEVQGLGWSSLVAGTNERLFIACRSCGGLAWLDPAYIEPLLAESSNADLAAHDAAVWRCRFCGNSHRSDDRTAMVRAACKVPELTDAGGWIRGHWQQGPDGKGLWTPEASFHENGHLKHASPATGIHRSLWLNSLYSKFIPIGRFLAEDRETAAMSDDERRAFVNGWMAEPYTVATSATSAEHISRIEVRDVNGYQHGQCPDPLWRISLMIDQQGEHAEKSWFPYVARGWNKDGSSSLIEAGEVDGFHGLDRLAAKTWPVAGQARAADIIGIDAANGPMTGPVRRWCAKQPSRRFSITGSGTMSPDHPWTEHTPTRRSLPRFHGLKLFYVFNVHHFRDALFDRLRGAEGEPAWRIPPDAPEFYTNSLQSEERVATNGNLNGRPVKRNIWVPREWVDPQGIVHVRHDNHWWDCEVDGLALVIIRGWFTLTPKRRRLVLAGKIGS